MDMLASWQWDDDDDDGDDDDNGDGNKQMQRTFDWHNSPQSREGRWISTIYGLMCLQMEMMFK